MSCKKIPIYLHIPKNAGTYIIHVLTKYYVRIFWTGKDLSIQRLTIQEHGYNLTIFVKFLTNYWQGDENMEMVSELATRAKKCTIDTLKTYINNKQLDVIAIVVEPVGKTLDLRPSFDVTEQVLNLTNKTGQYFTILRDCFSRQQSLFHYITGSESVHEPSHNTIVENTFINYLTSARLEDSWLIRSITGMPDELPITNFWYKQCCYFLENNNFIIENIHNIDTTLNSILSNSHGEELKDQDTDISVSNKNTTSSKLKITIEDLPEQTKQHFLKHTYWDRKLWFKYYKK
jgi:hypothetical protein